MDRIIEEAGALHGIVANAGRTKHKPALEFTDEEIQGLFSVNVSLRSFIEPCGGRWVTVEVVWLVLHGPDCRESVYSVGDQRIDCLYGIHGIVSTEQGTSSLTQGPNNR